MPPILLSLYGPFAIHSFGVMIACALIIALFLLGRDKALLKIISQDQLANIFQISLVSGIIGGRIWFLITNPESIWPLSHVFAIWNGGLSILGAIIAIIITLTSYLRLHKIPILPTMDRLALYAPLAQSIARFGCFFAGCCFGAPTDLAWGIMYTNSDALAPLGQALHPTQLYSSAALALSFLTLLIIDRSIRCKPGQITALYLIFMSIDRFFIDFYRGDREFFSANNLVINLSIQQFVALFICIAACILLLITLQHSSVLSKNKKSNESI